MKLVDIVDDVGPETEPLPSRTSAIAVARGVDTTTPEWRERFGRAAYETYAKFRPRARPWSHLKFTERESWARAAAAVLVEAAKEIR